MRYWLVMPAAGSSQRFGGAQPKQFSALAGSTVMELALRPFLEDPRCAGAVLVLAAEQLQQAAAKANADANAHASDHAGAGAAARLLRVAGGARRCDSVLCGLAALDSRAAADDWVLVHDAARPCLSAADLTQLLSAGQGQAVGALLATRVSDTIKQAGEAAGTDGRAASCDGTVDRERLWQAQTPQMFRYAPLCQALRAALAAGRAPTDEAQSFEWQGLRPLLVAARYANLKITTAEDLVIAGALLAARAGAARENA
jgi:2-C-methyl-D-erythritol 4-phosphate cytidylyltransferase